MAVVNSTRARSRPFPTVQAVAVWITEPREREGLPTVSSDEVAHG